MALFRHMLMLTFKDGTTDEQRSGLAAGFARMPEVMDYIRRYEFGFDLGNLGPGNPHFGLVADFDSENDWRRYSEHPEHKELAAEVQAVTAYLTRLQYLIG